MCTNSYRKGDTKQSLESSYVTLLSGISSKSVQKTQQI